MPDLDAKEYVENHLPGSLTAIAELATRQLARYNILCGSVAGMQANNGVFHSVCIRLGAKVTQQGVICEWLALHNLKLSISRWDARSQEFVLFVEPPVPVLPNDAQRRNS